MVSLLLSAGADVKAADKEGWTPLQGAAGSRDVKLVQLLLDHGADVNTETTYHSTPLDFAAEMGSLDIVRLLVSRGARVHGRSGLDALGQAVFKGRADVVDYLLSKGVEVNKPRWEVGTQGKEDTGWSLLMIAIKREHTDIAKTLIRHGANVNVRSKYGMTALRLAERDADELVPVLKRAGARR